jgi:hypothetical protein
MRALLLVAVLCGTAHATSFRMLGPLEEVIEDPLEAEIPEDPANVRVIDTRRMHVLDCLHDVKRHGLCAVRLIDPDIGDDPPAARRYRFELLEEILESAETVID